MRVHDVVTHCLAKPGAEETYPFGDHDLVAKVGGKGFAFIGLHTATVTVTCGVDAEDAAAWRHRYPDAIVQSAYIGRYGWNRVDLAAVASDDVYELLDASYDTIVGRLPKAKRPG